MNDADARAAVAAAVSRETMARLDVFVEELRRWQKAKNLVGPSTLDTIWSRHVIDSLQLLPLAQERRRWLDLGSGAGLPGLIIALTGGDGVHVDLVESNDRKCAFLRHVARLTGAPATVHAERLEVVIPRLAGDVEVVCARALASLDQLIAWCNPLWRKGVVGLFPKGQDVEAELTVASKSWMIQYDLVASQTDAKARIVQVHSVAPR